MEWRSTITRSSHALASGQRTSLAAPPLAVVIAAVLLALLLGTGAAASASNVSVLVLCGLALALPLALMVVIVMPHRIGDALLLILVAAIAWPVKKHFDVHEGIVGWPGFRISAADLPLIVLLPVVGMGVWLGRTRNAIPRPVLILYACLLVQYLFSVVSAGDPEIASFEYASAFHALLLAVVVGATFRSELVRPMIALLAFQVVVHTTFAVAQAWTGRPVGAEWFTATPLVQETLQSGVVRLRPIGLFDHPIVYGDMLTVTLPILCAGLFVSSGRIWRAALALTLAAGLVGLALTLSRGAWVATVIAGGTLLALAVHADLLSPRQLVRIVGGASVAVLLFAAVFGPRIWERVTASDEGNLSVRFELNWVALRIIGAHPLAGVGLNNIVSSMDGYDPTNVKERLPGPTHNVYLLEAAEAGIPAGILFILLYMAILIHGVRGLPHMPDRVARSIAAAIIAGLAGFLVSQLADFSHRLEPLRSLIWMNIGLLFALQRRSGRRGNGVELHG
jgi:O-antigen ligase